MFKYVDGSLTTIFKRVQNVNKGFDLTSNSITECVNKFNTFNQNRDFGDDWTRFLNKISTQNINVANQFEELSKQGASARASVEGVYSAILNGNTRGFGNVKSIISLYNEIGKVNPQNQASFASAVSQTNVQLGTYLMSIRNGTASMKGYAQQLVSTTAKTLALRVASVALNTVLMSAIPVAIGYIINKHKEEQQAIKDTGEEAEAQTNKIQSLYQSYSDMKIAVDNGTESKENLTSATNDLLEALGYEGSAVDDLIEKYGSLENAIDNVVISKLQEAHADLVASVAVYEDELLKIGDDWSVSKWGNANTFSFLGDNKEYQKIKDVLNQAEGLTSSVSYGYNGRSNRYSYSLSGDNSTIEGIKQNYETLLALQEDFINEFGAEEAGKLDIYKDINSRLNEIKTAYENYTSEVEALNQNAAKTQVLQSLIGKELPQTIDEYKAYRQELIKSAQSSGAFIGSQEDIANSIDNTLSQMSEFEKFQKRLNNLETAKSLFVEGRFNSKPINDYIESLSDEELEILVGLDTDIFDQGIDYVQKTIDEMNGISIHGSFEFTDYQEDLETVYGNIENLQDAITKLDENKFDFSGDIQDLIKAFPEYSTEILNASGDTEQLRKVLQDLLNAQPNDLIDSLTELKGSLVSDEDIKAVDNLINILRNSASVAYSVTSLSDSLQDLNDKESILSTVWKEMNDDGYISVSTYKSLCEMGEDYADIVSIVDDKLTLNVVALKELTKKKYEDEIATLRLTRAEEWHNAIIAGKNGEDTSKYTAIIDNIDAEIEAKKNVLKLYENYDYKSEGSSGSDDDTPKSVKNFETELALRQHEIATGKRKENADYYDWLLSAAHKAYDGLADYEEDLWKYEEQVYEWRKDHEQDLFDQRIENLDKEKEKALENNDFSTAKTSVNTQITETQNRIIELKTSGKQDVDDEIKQLEEDLDDLNDTLNEINSQEYEFNISVIKDNVDEQIETLDRSIENTGDTKLYSEKIKVYKDGQQQILDMIEFYRKQGYAEDSAIIKELKKQWNDYQDSISDTYEEHVNAQIDAYSDAINDQIDMLNKYKEEQDSQYEKEISALEEKKKALEKQTDELEKQEEIEEKKKALIDAQRNVYKSLRMVYDGNGNWVVKPTQEALDNVEEAKKDLEGVEQEQLIEALENQIDTIKEKQEAFDNSIDKQINGLNDSNDEFERIMSESLETRKTLDAELIKAIMGEEKAQEFLNSYDEAQKVKESANTSSANEQTDVQNDTQTNNDSVKSTGQEILDLLHEAKPTMENLNTLMEKVKETFSSYKDMGSVQSYQPDLQPTTREYDSVINNINNSPTLNNYFTITGANAEEIAKTVSDTFDTKIIKSFQAFYDGYYQASSKTMYGNK